MKFSAVALLLLAFLVGCTGPVDPYQQIDQAKGYLRQTREAAEAHDLATAEAEAEDEAARLATAGAAEAEIQLVQVAMSGTRAAIEAGRDALVLAGDSEQATRAAWDMDIRATQTVAVIQATQAIQPTAIAAAMQAAAARADVAQVAANAAPFVALIIILALLAAIMIGLRWLWMLVEWKDRINGQVHTKIGLVQYKAGGDLVDRAPLRIPGLADDPIPAAPVIDGDEIEDVQPPTMREQAVELLERGQEIYGDETDHIPGWRAAGDGWSSSKWQSVIGYLSSVGLAYKSGAAYRARPTCGDAIYKIETTTPGRQE